MAASLLCASASYSFAQTNIPTDKDSFIEGTFKASNTRVVKGADAASSYLSTAITVASTVRQVDFKTERTNSSGVVTYKDSFKKYAFGNKEILQLALGTNRPTGYTLAYTNLFANFPLDSGAFVAHRGTNNPVPVTNIAVSSYSTDIYTSDHTYRLPGRIYTKENYSGYQDRTVDLGAFRNLPALVSYNLVWPKRVVFGTGTNRTTNTHFGMTATGKFSAMVLGD